MDVLFGGEGKEVLFEEECWTETEQECTQQEECFDVPSPHTSYPSSPKSTSFPSPPKSTSIPSPSSFISSIKSKRSVDEDVEVSDEDLEITDADLKETLDTMSA